MNDKLIGILLVVRNKNDVVEIAKRIHGYPIEDAVVLDIVDLVKILECLVEKAVSRFTDIDKLSTESRRMTTVFKMYCGYYSSRRA